MPADLSEDAALKAELKDKGHWREGLWGGEQEHPGHTQGGDLRTWRHGEGQGL